MIPGSDGGQPAIELDNGDSSEVVNHGFFAHQPTASPNIEFARKLNLKLSETGRELAVTMPFHETSVSGCFAAGDIATAFRVVAGAVSAGVACSGGIVGQL